jgi:hypothetical protein
MLCFQIIEHYHVEDQMTWVSLGVIMLVMIFGIAASIIKMKNEQCKIDARNS